MVFTIHALRASCEPARQHVAFFEVEVAATEKSKASTAIKWKCGFCEGTRAWSSWARIRGHLSGVAAMALGAGSSACPHVTDAVALVFKAQIDESILQKQQTIVRKRGATAVDGAKGGSRGSAPPQPAPTQRSLVASFGAMRRELVDEKVANFFFGCKVPFNCADSVLFSDMVEALKTAPANYKAPYRQRLEQQQERQQQEQQEKQQQRLEKQQQRLEQQQERQQQKQQEKQQRLEQRQQQEQQRRLEQQQERQQQEQQEQQQRLEHEQELEQRDQELEQRERQLQQQEQQQRRMKRQRLEEERQWRQQEQQQARQKQQEQQRQQKQQEERQQQEQQRQKDEEEEQERERQLLEQERRLEQQYQEQQELQSECRAPPPEEIEKPLGRFKPKHQPLNVSLSELEAEAEEAFLSSRKRGLSEEAPPASKKINAGCSRGRREKTTAHKATTSIDNGAAHKKTTSVDPLEKLELEDLLAMELTRHRELEALAEERRLAQLEQERLFRDARQRFMRSPENQLPKPPNATINSGSSSTTATKPRTPAAPTPRATPRVESLASRWRSTDPYVVLGVPRLASRDTIRRAWRALILKFHPDKSRIPLAREIFIAISEAYRRVA